MPRIVAVAGALNISDDRLRKVSLMFHFWFLPSNRGEGRTFLGNEMREVV